MDLRKTTRGFHRRNTKGDSMNQPIEIKDDDKEFWAAILADKRRDEAEMYLADMRSAQDAVDSL